MSSPVIQTWMRVRALIHTIDRGLTSLTSLQSDSYEMIRITPFVHRLRSKNVGYA